jgi:uncharacterized protein YdeI (YjbR/CyaY-like superfamily)
MKVTYFQSSGDFRSWLAQNHDHCTELFVGFYKKASGKPSITYPEALDQALCFGWIDGVRKSVDALSYTVRFTPRKAKSYWSMVNTKRAKELIRLGLMEPPGLKAFQARDPSKSKRYSFERENAKQFKANPKAWVFFQAQAPYYQRIATWWVISAKQEPTRLRRLQTLIDLCAHHRRHPQFLSPKKR